MSPTRKARPPDKGSVPEHKPSHKVAMNEVLRTLQDLVQNELVVEPAKSATSAGTGPLRRAQTTEPVPAPSSETPALESLPDLADLPPPAAPPPAPAIPPGGLQQDLPYLETPSLESADAPSAPVASPSQDWNSFQHKPETSLSEMPGLTLETETTAEIPATATDNTAIIDFDAPSPSEMPEAALPAVEAELPAEEGDLPDLGDFPVLEDAVELSHEADASTLELPSAADARRLAIQVAARLNVELRREGQAGLSSDIIARLAHMLEEALAKAGANMENTGPEQH